VQAQRRVSARSHVLLWCGLCPGQAALAGPGQVSVLSLPHPGSARTGTYGTVVTCSCLSSEQ